MKQAPQNNDDLPPLECQHAWQRTRKPNAKTGGFTVTDACGLCGLKTSREVDPVPMPLFEVKDRDAGAGKVIATAAHAISDADAIVVTSGQKTPEQVGMTPTPAPSPAPQPSPPIAPATEPPQNKGSVVVKAGATGALVPTTIQEAWLFCGRMAKSFTLPPAFYAAPKLPEGFNPGNIDMMEVATARAFQAMQLGMEAGLPPAQAIQSVMVMNGIGTLWGDSQLALVIDSGKSFYVKEYTEGGDLYTSGVPNRDYTWVCETHRKGDEIPFAAKFSVADAMRASLWDKKGTWQSHPNRMGMYKVRAFCLRDKYPDVLKGLAHSTEEMEGEILDVTPKADHIAPADPAAKLSGALKSDMLEQVSTGNAIKAEQKQYSLDNLPFSEGKDNGQKT